MTALAAGLGRDTKAGPYVAYAVKGSTTIYRGSAVGLTSGYARAYVAGDLFVGFNVENDITNSGSDGAVKANVLIDGYVSVPVTSVAVTDIGKAVWATDDNAFTTTNTTDTQAIGHIVGLDYNRSGYAIIRFKANFKALAKVTAPTGGATQDAESRTAINTVITALENHGIVISN